MRDFDPEQPTVLAKLPTKFFDIVLEENAIICKFPSQELARFAMHGFLYVFANWAKNLDKKECILIYPGSKKRLAHQRGYTIPATMSKPCTVDQFINSQRR